MTPPKKRPFFFGGGGQESICDKKRFVLRCGDQKKTVKNGITLVIICKLFEIIKGSIIILSVDCNTHLHTLSKNKKKFECNHYWRKQRGAGHQVGGKCSFGGRQKFLADGVARGFKIWLSEKNYLV